MNHQIIVIGAGAAGVFAAIRAAELNPGAHISILEAQSRPLGKVKISGGGRCNVTHDCQDISRLVGFYPRGSKELRSAFSRFSVRDSIQWFSSRGVKLKTEADGRMFPVTDRSETIIHALLSEVERRNIKLRLGCPVERIESQSDQKFIVKTKHGDFESDRLLISTGGLSSSYKFAAGFGHNMVEPIPSLFSFKIEDPLLKDLPGISMSDAGAELTIGQKKFKHRDPFLITHWGLSGPLIIRLSAWAAIDLYHSKYMANLFLDLLPELKAQEIYSEFEERRLKSPKRLLRNDSQFGIPPRFWENVLKRFELDQKTWQEVSNKQFQSLSANLKRFEFKVSGKGAFKEEFVTSGGVDRKEIDFRTMQSKIRPNLYFAGEIVDVDGITGGFNFQFAWTSGFIAGSEMAK